MSNPVLERGVSALNFSRQALLQFLEDIPEDKLTHQPCAAGNHALWIAGHIAGADDYFMTHVGNKPARCPESWGKLFGMGVEFEMAGYRSDGVHVSGIIGLIWPAFITRP